GGLAALGKGHGLGQAGGIEPEFGGRLLLPLAGRRVVGGALRGRPRRGQDEGGGDARCQRCQVTGTSSCAHAVLRSLVGDNAEGSPDATAINIPAPTTQRS